MAITSSGVRSGAGMNREGGMGLVERPIGPKGMEVDEKTEVKPKTPHDADRAHVQGRHGRQSMLLFDARD